MSDQEDFDRELTPSQEHTIAFAVILLFGAMYLFFMKGCQPIASSIGQAFGPHQTSQVITSQGHIGPLVAEHRALANEGTVERERLKTDGKVGAERQAQSDLGEDSPKPQAVVSSEAADVEISSPNAQARVDKARDADNIKAQAASLAAATAAQKLADEERLQAKQAVAKAKNGELAIPEKPLETTSAVPQQTAAAQAKSQVKKETVVQTPKEQQNKPFDKNAELARVDFVLPDGRSVQIPQQGFENSFKKSILEGRGSNDEAIVFDRVYFYSGSDLLNPDSSNQILGVAGIMNTYKDIHVKLRGHTDSTGQAENNLTLSFNRSRNLKKQLVGLGIEANRIQVEGLGATEPVSDNQSEKGRNKNRRIDLTIIR